MSVVWVKSGELQFEEKEQKTFFPVKECAMCGENLWRGDFIFWSGHIDMGFHTECAEHLGISLLKDVREWELGTVPHYKERAEQAVKKHIKKHH